MDKGNPTFAFTPPEVRLLLACGRRPDAPEAARLLDAALAGRELDWPFFISLTRNHGLEPLAHAHLAGRREVPQDIRQRLSAEADRVARSNLFQAAILHALLDDLTAAGAAPLVLKGLPLAASLYGDPGLRPAGDLDLLVRSAHLERAAAVLAGRGYELLEDYGPLTPRRLEALRRGGKHYHYIHLETRSHVELHWEPVTGGGPRRATEEFWWDTIDTVSMDGRAVPVLDEPHTLVQLAAHGGGHLWERLIWAVDVAEYLRRVDADTVAEVLRLAGGAGFQAHIVVAAALAMEGLETPLPRGTRVVIERAARAPAARAVLRSARGLAAARALSAPTGTVRRLAAGAPWNGGLPATFRRAVELALAPSPTDWLAVPLPDRLFPLYRIIRPPRIALKYARALGERLRCEGEGR